MARHALNTNGVASLVGMLPQRVRRYIHEKIVSEDRHGSGRSAPFIFWEEHIGQLLITKELRELRVGLDTVRDIIEEYDFGADDFTIHWDYVFITINMKAVRRQSKTLMTKSTRSDETFKDRSSGEFVALS